MHRASTGGFSTSRERQGTAADQPSSLPSKTSFAKTSDAHSCQPSALRRKIVESNCAFDAQDFLTSSAVMTQRSTSQPTLGCSDSGTPRGFSSPSLRVGEMFLLACERYGGCTVDKTDQVRTKRPSVRARDDRVFNAMGQPPLNYLSVKHGVLRKNCEILVTKVNPFSR